MSKTSASPPLYTVITQNRFAELLSDDESDTSGRPLIKSTVAASGVSFKTEGTTEAGDASRRRQPKHHGKETTSSHRTIALPLGRGRPRGIANGETATSVRGIPAVIAVGDTQDSDQPQHSRPPPPQRRLARGGGAFRDNVQGGFRHRTFDRHSGTGRGREMKKSGAGGHNWGNEAADFGADEALASQPPTTAPAALTLPGKLDSTGCQLDEASPEQEAEKQPANGHDVIYSHSGSSGDMTPTPGCQSASPAPAPPAPPQEPRMIDYAEYQRTQRLKRATLLQGDETTAEKTVSCGGLIASGRFIDASELEKAGFQKYERDETSEERAVREQQLLLQQRACIGGSRDDPTSDEEPAHRSSQRTYNLSEFTGRISRPGGRGGRRGDGRAMHSAGGSKSRGDEAHTHFRKRIDPMTLDLTDSAAFPSLA